MKKWFAYGGIDASVVLIVFGICAIVIGATGYNDVRDEIAQQNITAGDDAAELTGGSLQPGEKITTGAEARAFADIMEQHTLESTEGTWNLGIGFFAVVRADAAASVISALGALGLPSWQAGTVTIGERDLAGFEQGAKGVDGGAVRLVGSYAS